MSSFLHVLRSISDLQGKATPEDRNHYLIYNTQLASAIDGVGIFMCVPDAVRVRLCLLSYKSSERSRASLTALIPRCSAAVRLASAP